jgi:hypothetical protein
MLNSFSALSLAPSPSCPSKITSLINLCPMGNYRWVCSWKPLLILWPSQLWNTKILTASVQMGGKLCPGW